MLPILKKIYKDDKPGLSAAMEKDNLEFINTHPNLTGRIPDGVINFDGRKRRKPRHH